MYKCITTDEVPSTGLMGTSAVAATLPTKEGVFNAEDRHASGERVKPVAFYREDGRRDGMKLKETESTNGQVDTLKGQGSVHDGKLGSGVTGGKDNGEKGRGRTVEWHKVVEGQRRQRIRHYVQHNYHDYGHYSAMTEKKTGVVAVEVVAHPSWGVSGTAVTDGKTRTCSSLMVRERIEATENNCKEVPTVNDDDKAMTSIRKKRSRGCVPRGGVTTPFPLKLHGMLNRAEEEEQSHIICWQSHGRCFIVHDTGPFVSILMPRYFNQTKMTSFQRQLNLYGFKKLTAGPDKGAYYHELFLRGKPSLSRCMSRMRIKGTGCKGASNPGNEPNFYEMPTVIPDNPQWQPPCNDKLDSNQTLEWDNLLNHHQAKETATSVTKRPREFGSKGRTTNVKAQDQPTSTPDKSPLKTPLKSTLTTLKWDLKDSTEKQTLRENLRLSDDTGRRSPSPDARMPSDDTIYQSAVVTPTKPKPAPLPCSRTMVMTASFIIPASPSLQIVQPHSDTGSECLVPSIGDCHTKLHSKLHWRSNTISPPPTPLLPMSRIQSFVAGRHTRTEDKLNGNYNNYPPSPPIWSLAAASDPIPLSYVASSTELFCEKYSTNCIIPKKDILEYQNVSDESSPPSPSPEDKHMNRLLERRKSNTRLLGTPLYYKARAKKGIISQKAMPKLEHIPTSTCMSSTPPECQQESALKRGDPENGPKQIRDYKIFGRENRTADELPSSLAKQRCTSQQTDFASCEQTSVHSSKNQENEGQEHFSALTLSSGHGEEADVYFFEGHRFHYIDSLKDQTLVDSGSSLRSQQAPTPTVSPVGSYSDLTLLPHVYTQRDLFPPPFLQRSECSTDKRTGCNDNKKISINTLCKRVRGSFEADNQVGAFCANQLPATKKSFSDSNTKHDGSIMHGKDNSKIENRTRIELSRPKSMQRSHSSNSFLGYLDRIDDDNVEDDISAFSDSNDDCKVYRDFHDFTGLFS